MVVEASTVQDLSTNTKGQMYGTSKYIQPNPAGFIAEAELGNSCRCCPCSFCSCPAVCDCVSPEMEKRTYARIYENRLEINYAWTYLAACCCMQCSNKSCVSDNVAIYYFDMPPTSAWSAPFPFCCVPCTCFGRPAVAIYTPKCCCCSCENNQTLIAGPCSIKCCICCGDSCFPCSSPILNPVKNGDQFMSALKAAYESYAAKRNISLSEQAKFYHAEDGCCGFNISPIPENIWNRELVRNLVEFETGEAFSHEMERE